MSVSAQLKGLLLQSGLSEAETVVYLEILRKPTQTVWELKQRTGLMKSTVYLAVNRLQEMKMIGKDQDGLKALSLKGLVADLDQKERKLRKTAQKIRQLAPFLRMPSEAVESFETCYTQEQMADAYLFMSALDYSVNLDFGDFESFIPAVGGIELGQKFRINRMKHAANYAICTTFGPNTAYFTGEKAGLEFKSRIEMINVDFKNRWIEFSDNNDYVLFNDVSNPEDPSSVLVKSKTIADMQRQQFDLFSKQFRNL